MNKNCVLIKMLIKSRLKFKSMNKKAALQISFQWLFALIVGAFILFIAIYAATKVIQTDQTSASAEASKELGILLNPLETGFESGKTNLLSVQVETRIYNTCDNFGEFGQQTIQAAQKTFNKWTETPIDARFQNKYIFSEKPVEGKNFYVFSKPFEFPFKITDLIYLTSAKENYCFVEPPVEIEEELRDLKQGNLFVEDCPENSIRVCFNNGNCEIDVDYFSGYVEKNNELVYFETPALMYAAVFSDKYVYKCQVKRIMQRLENLALLYKDKSGFIAQQGCVAEMDPDLIALSNLANSFEDTGDLSQMTNIVNALENKNDFAECRLW